MDRGFHYIIDAFGCPVSLLTDDKLMFDFLQMLPTSVGMRVIDGPHVKYYGNEDISRKEEQGPTGVVVLAESHASLHSYPFKQYMAFDLFSCKEFEKEQAREIFVAAYKPERISELFFLRGFIVEGAANIVESGLALEQVVNNPEVLEFM